MRIVDIWDYCLTYVRRNPDKINMWYNTVYDALTSYNKKAKMNDKCRELIDLIFFHNKFNIDSDEVMNTIYIILNAISNIAIIENSNKYAVILLLASDDMVEFTHNLPNDVRYQVETDLVYSICNASFTSDYIDYTIYHVFRNEPFLEYFAKNSYDKKLISSLKDKIKSDDNYIKEICYYNIDEIANYLWDLCNNKDARIYMIKKIYDELYSNGSVDMEKILNKYSILLPGHNFMDISMSIEYILTTNPYRFDYEIGLYLFNEFTDEIISSSHDKIMDILKCYIDDIIYIMYDRGIIKDKSISKTLYLSLYMHFANTFPGGIESIEPYIKSNENNMHDVVNESNNNALDIILESAFTTRTKMAHTYHKAESTITKGYNAYKRNEMQVDNQLSKILGIVKKGFTGDARTEIIEGKEFSPITLLKRILKTAAIFHFNKIGAILYVLIGKIMRGKAYASERKKMLMELEEEIEIINEKIEDAKADNNRKAKYNLMRTKKELENARDRIKYGITADKKSDTTAGSLLMKNAESNRNK